MTWLPVITTTDVDAATLAWGVDRTQQRLVIRKGTEVRKFDSVTNDGVWVRAIARVSRDNPQPGWDRPYLRREPLTVTPKGDNRTRRHGEIPGPNAPGIF